MAISENRLSGDALASLVTTSFDKAKSSTKQSASVAATIAAAAKKSALLNMADGNQAMTPKSTAIGVVVNDVSKCNPVTKTDVNTKTNLDRGFKKESNKCSDVKKIYDEAISTIDGFKTHILTSGKTVTNNISKITGKESYIYKTLKNVPFSKNIDLTTKVNNKYKKLTSSLGGTIKNKLNINSPLFNCMVGSLDSYLPGDSNLLKSLTLSSALDASGCIKSDKILAFLTDIETTGIYNRMDVVAAVVGAVSKTDTTSMINKLNTLKGYKSTLTTLKDQAEFTQKTMTSSSKIMNNIKNSDINSNSPTSDYNNIITGMSAIDPLWDKDKNGNTDYSKFRDNRTMTKLARVVTPAGSTFTGTPTDTVTTAVPASVAIRIVSSRKDATNAPSGDIGYTKLISNSGYNNLKTADTIV